MHSPAPCPWPGGPVRAGPAHLFDLVAKHKYLSFTSSHTGCASSSCFLLVTHRVFIMVLLTKQQTGATLCSQLPFHSLVFSTCYSLCCHQVAGSWSTHYRILSQWLGPGRGTSRVGSPPLFVTETMSLLRKCADGTRSGLGVSSISRERRGDRQAKRRGHSTFI